MIRQRRRRGRGVGGRGGWAAVVALAGLATTAGCFSTPSDSEAVSSTREALGSWPGILTHHADLARTGANLNETILTTSNVSTSTFGKLFSRTVDGYIYAQPLYVPAAIGGKNVVYVATEANTVYAFDADDPAATAPLASLNLGPPMPWTDAPAGCVDLSPSMSSFSGLDTNPNVGITSTPVIDAAAGVMYVADKTKPADGIIRYMLHKLRIDTLAEVGTPVQITGSFTNGGVTTTFNAQKQLNRVALTLSGTHLYIGFASHCDSDPYHGWVFNYDTTTMTQTTPPFVTTPAGKWGGIWMAGSGFPVDASGNLFFEVGNSPGGTTDLGTNLATKGLGETFVKLPPSGFTTRTAIDYFMPKEAATLDNGDVDLGSSGPLLVPGQNVLVGSGKEGFLYVLDATNLGQFNMTADQVLQELRIDSNTSVGHEVAASPVYWDRSSGGLLYVWPTRSTLRAYSFSPTSLTLTAQATGSVAASTFRDWPGGALFLSANGSTPGSGILWVNHASPTTSRPDPNHQTVPATIYAFDAENVSHLLWSSDQTPARDAVDRYAKFNPPIVAGGKLYVPTFSNRLDVFGLLATPTDGGAGDGGPIDGPDCSPPVDPGAPQPTTWSYVYTTYLGPGTIGHCANCHNGTNPLATTYFNSGATGNSFYQGLVAESFIDAAAPTTSDFGQTCTSPLSWFGHGSMPLDAAGPNARAAAAVAGWVRAGAVNDCSSGTCPPVCTAPQQACGATCVDTTTDPNHCGTCATVCTGGATCVASKCSKATGLPCAAPVECATNACVDGFCCNTACAGVCTACSNARTAQPNGTCAPIAGGVSDARCMAAPPCGLDGTCNGAGACHTTVAGTVCGAASCAGGVAKATSTCDGSGACAAGAATSCVPYVCGATACKATCTTDADCSTGNHCAGGLCQANPALKAVGATCAAASECASAACVDGFCCNTACATACTACSNARTGQANGACAPIHLGTQDVRCGAPQPPCGLNSECDGAGACQLILAGTICGAATCSSGVAHAVSQCNGTGTCLAGAATSCGAYACDPTSCKTTCAADADCGAGNHCAGGACVPVATATALPRAGWIASASKASATDTPAKALDGATNTRFSTGAPMGNGMTFQVDMLVPQTFTKLTMDAAGSANDYARGYQVLVSSDGATWSSPIATGAGTAALVTVTFAQQTARYLRLVQTGAATNWWSIAELNVYGTPTTLKANGATCGAAAECASAACVDGFCCSSACTGACTACSNARTGQPSGTCAPSAGGVSDSRCLAAPPCGNDGTCNGAGACHVTAAGTSCAAASCAAGSARAASTCNGTGTCVAPAATPCTPYVCGATACKATCAVDTDCAAGFHCAGGLCQASGTLVALPRAGWLASASKASATDTPAKALDGATNTRFSTGADGAVGMSFQVDMLAAQTFTQITMDSAGSTADYARGYQVLVSTNGTTWSSPVATGAGTAALVTATFPSQTARYVRVVLTAASTKWWSLAEFNVWH